MKDHIPVLVDEFLEFFENCQIVTFCDGTLGAAGHSEKILKKHPEIVKLIGIDQDETAIKIAKEKLDSYKEKVTIVHDNFSNLEKILNDLNVLKVDGFFFDLGISSMQVDDENRGFSFKYDAHLDMRMDVRNPLTCETVINEYPVEQIEKILLEYGEEKRAKIVAREIVKRRKENRIITTKDLLDIIMPFLKKKSKIHPATQIFQALRIFVNNEIEILKKTITTAVDRLNVNGRLGVISFHSLEDRIIKFLFKELAKDKIVKILTKKPKVASFNEVKINRRSRSAKLRFVEKII